MSDPIQSLCVAVFAIGCALMFYALFGYPLLLNWLARRSDNPVHKDDKLRSVSFVIAVYNGEKFLERKLRTIFAQNYPARADGNPRHLRRLDRPHRRHRPQFCQPRA